MFTQVFQMLARLEMLLMLLVIDVMPPVLALTKSLLFSSGHLVATAPQPMLYVSDSFIIKEGRRAIGVNREFLS